LGLHGIFGCPEEPLDPQMLLDPNSGSWSRVASPYGMSVRLLRAGSGRL
jgi:hypothetical protein